MNKQKPEFEMCNDLATLRTSIALMDMEPDEADAFTDSVINAYMEENLTPERVGNVAAFMQAVLLDAAEIEGAAKPYKEYWDAQAAKAKYSRNKVERVKARMIALMDLAGVEVLGGGLNKLCIEQNPPAVEIVDVAQVPDEYWKPGDLDKAKASADMKAGKDIPGLCLTRGRKLVIK